MLIVSDRDAPRAIGPSVVTIGVFDGLHRGHRAVIEELGRLAREYQGTATVVTFDPAPTQVLNPSRAPRLLATMDQRLDGFATLAVEQVRVVNFDDAVANESAKDFVERVIVGELAARCVVVGQDFRFGHNREGTVELLGDWGRRRGFDVIAAPPYGEPERWSSTAVRSALAAGDLGRANDILGRFFTLRAPVVHGDARARALGFPTANLDVAAHQQLPDDGVYAGATFAGGAWRAAAISVGRRPQYYEEGPLVVEVNVLNYRENLYESVLNVAFVERLRGQETFVEERDLVAQVALDVAKTGELFAAMTAREVELLGWGFGQRR